MTIDNMKVGDIVLYSSKGFIPRAIQFFSKSKWNHASVVVEVDGEKLILEAAKEGVVLNAPEDSFKGKELMIMRPRFEIERPDDFSSMAIKLTISKPYDIFALIWHQLVFKLTGRRKWVGRKHIAYKRLYCSELVAYVYHLMYGVFPDWYKTSPVMLRENEEHFEPIVEFDGDKDFVIEPETTDEPMIEDKSGEDTNHNKE